nr:peptidylprolyl isomerase [Variovorax paradoxus]
MSRKDDPRTIVVGAEVDAEARKLFAASRGREPDAGELKALRERWVDNEVLYREGLALQVDQGDTAIRERVIFKALSVVDAGVKLPSFDDELLRRWFESKRNRYDEPLRFDFQEAVVSADASESAVRAFVEALNNGTPGDARAGLRVFKGRPRDNLVQSYGPDFAKALEQAPPGEWRALSTRDGLRAIRLDAITPPKAADFETLRGVVLQDWTDATLADQRTAAVRAMGKKYTVKIEGDTK